METSLHAAVIKSDVEAVAQLLAQGADINARDGLKNTALHLAIKRGDVGILQLLCNNSKIDVNVKNDMGRTGLEIAVRKDDLTMTNIMIEAGADLNIINKSGKTALHAAVKNNNTEMIECLLKNGANVNARDHLKETALHCAVKNNKNFKVCELLLVNQADPNLQNLYGNSPVHILLQNERSIKFIELFLRYKANGDLKNLKDETPSHIAAEHHDFEAIKLFLDYGSDVNRINEYYKETFLHQACAVRNYSMIKYLLKKGAHVDALDYKRRTPVMIALDWESIEMGRCLEFLITYIDVNIVSKGGKTLLNYEPAECDWKTILEHIAKLQVLDIPLNSNLIDTISSRNDYSEYFTKCKQELEKLKSTRFLNSWVTLLNLLLDNRKQIKNYSGNQDLVEKVLKANFQEFPIYGSSVESNMQKGVKRRELFDKATISLSRSCPIFNQTHLIIRDILDCCLCKKDLQKLSE